MKTKPVIAERFAKLATKAADFAGRFTAFAALSLTIPLIPGRHQSGPPMRRLDGSRGLPGGGNLRQNEIGDL